MYVVVIWAAVLIHVRCGYLGGCIDRSRTVYVVVIWVAVLIGPGQCTLWSSGWLC